MSLFVNGTLMRGLALHGNLVGAESSLTRNINYSVNPGGLTGSLIAQGGLVSRHFKSNELEYYAQDSWRVTDRLTARATSKPVEDLIARDAVMVGFELAWLAMFAAGL